MRQIGNILWHIPFLGFLSCMFAYFLGGIYFLTGIGAPIGLGMFQLGRFYLSPYTHSMVDKNLLNKHLAEPETENKAWEIYKTIVMICWIPFGLVAAIIAAFQALFICCSIIGIPVGLVIFKTLPVLLNPVGKVCVPYQVAAELERRDGEEELKKYKLAS